MDAMEDQLVDGQDAMPGRWAVQLRPHLLQGREQTFSLAVQYRQAVLSH